MPQYLVQVAYTSETMAALVNNPQDRVAVVSKAVKKLGGKVVGGWLSFGEYDTALITHLPDNVSAAAFSIAVSAGGACKSVKTTPLLSVEEGIEAMKAAATLGYKPPAA
ncbi:GYD domain-containing protein [Edaphobacter bradus]|uniref:GYD domain-containing protein n=1 Tax=Edaphobacter bradus TaxID=2259016 RepID=UPI0021E0F134|nr:GYD domain-containing protein [Edaphobacter bradus]